MASCQAENGQTQYPAIPMSPHICSWSPEEEVEICKQELIQVTQQYVTNLGSDAFVS